MIANFENNIEIAKIENDESVLYATTDNLETELPCTDPNDTDHEIISNGDSCATSSTWETEPSNDCDNLDDDLDSCIGEITCCPCCLNELHGQNYCIVCGIAFE